jgi:sulfide:quinone oxidoreductase
MVDIFELERNIAVAPQLAEADFAEIAQHGFCSIVNNRPDGEASDQLPNVKAAAAARRYGLEYRYLPVPNLNVTDDEAVSAFARLMDDLPGPILFYCRTGTRCSVLWAQAAARRLGIDAALAAARDAGFELEFLRDTLTERGDWCVPASAPISISPVQTVAGG